MRCAGIQVPAAADRKRPAQFQAVWQYDLCTSEVSKSKFQEAMRSITCGCVSEIAES